MKRFSLFTYLFILVAVTVTSFCIAWFSELYVERSYREAIEVANRDISRGCFYLMEKEITSVPEVGYNGVIAELQEQFGYPISIKRTTELAFNERERQQADEGKIIVRDDGDLLYARIGKSDYFIGMGPFKEVDLRSSDTVAFFAAGALLLGLMILPWALLLWKRLDRISIAAARFGTGDFSARVELPRFSSLADIGRTFNGMADQIERLISSHKHLVNAVSHELRTPISRIRFGLEEVREAEGAEKVRHLAGIRQDLDELDELVSELLSYARFERAATGVEFQEKPLLPWLDEYLRYAGESLGTAIDFSSAGVGSSLLVRFDPRLLERALHNLLQNGSRFAASGLTVRLTAREGKARIAIGDDGPGIPEEDRQRIFDPFTRLESSRNRATGGYGLGLSIVREIMRNHDGSVTVGRSEAGGAEFILTLPLAKR